MNSHIDALKFGCKEYDLRVLFFFFFFAFFFMRRSSDLI
jgi:hypothetical protein